MERITRWGRQNRKWIETYKQVLYLILLASIYQVYFVKILIPLSPSLQNGVTNAHTIIATETGFGGKLEHWVQNEAINDGLIPIANFIYTYSEFVFCTILGTWLFFKKPTEFYLWRGVLIIAWLISLCIFVIYPVVPPRLMQGMGFHDTITKTLVKSDTYGVAIVQNGAMPSDHVIFAEILGAAFFMAYRKWYVKIGAIAFPIIVCWATIATGNHWLLDSIVGLTISYASYKIMKYWRRVKSHARIKHATKTIYPVVYPRSSYSSNYRSTSSNDNPPSTCNKLELE